MRRRRGRSRGARWLVTASVVLGLAGCGTSTRIQSSYAARNVPPERFERVLVLFMNAAEPTRVIAEDYLVEFIGADRAVPSYTLLTQEEAQDEARARERIEGQAFDGAVVMRVIGQSEQMTFEPGTSVPVAYGGFWGYYGYGWPSVYDPSYLREDTVVSVESTVYSLARDELLWAGISESFNPTDVEQTVGQIANAVSRELRREGLIAD